MSQEGFYVPPLPDGIYPRTLRHCYSTHGPVTRLPRSVLPTAAPRAMPKRLATPRENVSKDGQLLVSTAWSPRVPQTIRVSTTLLSDLTPPSMTLSNKAQLHSLKKAMRSTLKSKQAQAYSPNSIIAPLAAQSECSTLVDFGDDYLEEGEAQEQDDISILQSENSAWTRSRTSQAGRPSSSRALVRDTAVMLDSDEMSWNIPRDAKRSVPIRILHALAGQ
ncbi:hypothetical protein PHLGIDRAFT_122415 [Phlebiopsis gigantea 11061_1 CR5-6]|uniref:Uncharacterized protein n=1 Tax=Phlebiopsis gigantea (strain 11061_1 CR5-6) TaxID=745531 RepID=A0A0C3S3M4_PHLG1|nr:hypothetical protein PHLGIDRAFT_122415 [Phlebiopsis gigantea 11061_1 CR5-6]